MRISWKLLNILLFKEIYITCSFFREKFSKKDILTKYISILICWCWSSHPEVFLGKGVLKICSKYTLLCNVFEIWYGCSPVNLLHIQNTFSQEHLWVAASADGKSPTMFGVYWLKVAAQQTLPLYKEMSQWNRSLIAFENCFYVL